MKLDKPRHTRGAVVALIVALSLSACTSGIQSSSDVNQDVDFASMGTWAFISEAPMMVAQTDGPVNPLLEDRLEDSIRKVMTAKGYREADAASADLVVAFTVGAREKIKVDTYPSTFGGYYGRGPAGYYSGWNMGYGAVEETRVRQYTKGQLAVDLFVRETRAPAFHGAAEKTLTSADRENRQAALDEVTREAMSNLPPAGSLGSP